MLKRNGWIALVLAFILANCTGIAAQDGDLPEWDFAEAGSAIGWQSTHDLDRFTFDGEGLHTFASGGDPYMVNGRADFESAPIYYLEVRMRADKGNDAQFFWVTSESPNYDEAKSLHFDVKGDGEWHTYEIRVGESAAWKDRITGLRLDPANLGGAKITIAHIRTLGPKPGELAVRTFGPTQGIAWTDETFTISAVIENTGDAPLSARELTLLSQLSTMKIEGDAAQMLHKLAPGETATIMWEAAALEDGAPAFSLYDSDERLAESYVTVLDPDADTYVMENERLLLSIFRDHDGLSRAAALSAKVGDAVRPVGFITFGEIIHRTEEGTEKRSPIALSEIKMRENYIPLSVAQPCKSVLAVGFAGDGHALSISAAYYPNEIVKIVNWTPFKFYAGEGTFETAKESALFPGLEYLLDDEVSSGTENFDPSIADRYAPHPYKITVPLMAVTQDGISAGLTWEPLAEMPGEYDAPGALFASPNRWENQRNHLMALYWPGPTYTGVENDLAPAKPFTLEKNESFTLRARLFAIPAEDALAPIRYWLENNDLPPLPDIGGRDSIALSLRGSMKSAWEEGAQGWHYAIHDPWGPGASPANAMHLWLAALRGDVTGEEAARYREIARGMLERRDFVGGQPNPQLYIAPYYLNLGYLDGLAELKSYAADILNAQNDEGYWPYQSQGRGFGESGDTSNGQIAHNALILLNIGRVTGDRDLIAAGLKALDYLEANHDRRPEGAQTWELQLHAPDMLAAAWAQQAHLEAYKITGDAAHAERTQYWATQGLPFIYLWSAPDRDIMAYTTIPVFAATNFTSSWIGKPVMWNGLDYAFGLWDLNDALAEAGIEPLLDWRHLAEGITLASVQMQPEEGDFAGMYPDAWNVVTGTEAYSWWLHPYYILQNLYLMQGAPADVNTVILRASEKPVHVSAASAIARAEWEGSDLLVDLAYYAGETGAALVGGLEAAPDSVTVNGEAAEWQESDGMILVAVPFDDEGGAALRLVF